MVSATKEIEQGHGIENGQDLEAWEKREGPLARIVKEGFSEKLMLELGPQ